MYPLKNTCILKEFQMSKTCAFFGNDYQWTKNSSDRNALIEKVKEQILKLIDEEDVDTFFVGVKGAYENDAYDTVLDVRKERPNIQILLVVSNAREVNEGTRFCNDIIFPDKAEMGYKRWCIVHRNNWIIENTDFIIAYNRFGGRAFEVCKRAKNKGVQVIELADME